MPIGITGYIMLRFRPLVSCLLIWTGAAWADPPRVVADIAPVHSLVAMVMDGVASPDLLITQGTSPHDFALRPSQAQLLQDAELVVRVSTDLTPWLQKPLDTLAAEAEVLTLIEAPGTVRHIFRSDAHDEDAEHHGVGDDTHEHVHDPSAVDPHAWLDPENGAIWLGAIAEQLATLDPENAERYHANAMQARAGIEALKAEIAATLAPVKDRAFVTFHDAFQYFDVRFGLNFTGALSRSDAADPSPAQVADLRARLAAGDIRCAYREPQFNDRLLRAAAEGMDMHVGVLDPLGSALEPGPELYPQLLRAMAESLAACGVE